MKKYQYLYVSSSDSEYSESYRELFQKLKLLFSIQISLIPIAVGTILKFTRKDRILIRCKAKYLYVLFSILSINTLMNAQQIDDSKIHLTFDVADDDKYQEVDSLVNSINGKAGCFYNNKHLAIKDETLHPIWQSGNFSVELWMQTKAENKDYQVIATNKDWNSGEIKDYTTNSAFGFSRTTGNNKGWAIICQPDGSWALNIGDGERRLDYRPTAPRQKINDNEWHQIVFSINKQKEEARMYFDGVNVAIYNIKGLDLEGMNSGLPTVLANDALATSSGILGYNGAIDEFKVYNKIITSQEVAQHYKAFVPAAKMYKPASKKIESLNLMAWNIWHGGRRHGREIGPKQVIDFIKDTKTDIVMMQETYGSGALIADALGYYFYLASTNISVISKYPILDTKPIYDAFRCGVTQIQLSETQKINLASLWIHYLPAWRRDTRAEDATAEKLIAGEGKTRHKEILEITSLIDAEIKNADEIPLIIGGDFNSPSHKDWIAQTKDWHNGLAVQWPVSKVMQDKGFSDSFREINPDLNYKEPTMTAERLTYRIDYIYYKGKDLKAVSSNMHNRYKGVWPSDHPAVTTTIQLK